MCNISRPTRHPTRRAALGLLLAGVSGLAFGPPQGAMADAVPLDLPAPGPRDTCPVCGMFVARYPEWIATVVFADGTAAHFDGPKDMFKFLADVGKYAPGRDRAQITTMAVTEYYGLTRISATEAFFVTGSDVLGPMGHELVALSTAAEATEFSTDHAGKRSYRFPELPPGLPARLDEGRFE